MRVEVSQPDCRAISVHDTLGELVTAHPAVARELERYELDYCCGGRRTLAQACVSRGVDAEAVLADLQAADAVAVTPEWFSMGVVELVDHIEAKHHRYLHDELPRLSALTAKVLAAHGARHAELHDISGCVAAIRADLEPHLLKEERVLFPMIRELAAADERPSSPCGTVRNPIAVMTTEHEHVGELLACLRALTGDYVAPADGCRSYTALFSALAELEADTHLHVHKENNLLFPAVQRIEDQRPA
jgi:regulator of cell morphogenesis and NO signaling